MVELFFILQNRIFLYIRRLFKFQIMKIKLLFLLFFTSLISFSQNPISAFYGENMSSFSLATTANPINHGPSGANQIWNFDQLIALGTSIHTNVSPTTAETSTYPGTTTVMVSNSTINAALSTSKTYTKLLSNVFSFTGFINSGLTANFNTNNATLGAFPMNYGFSNNDNVAGNYVYTTYSGTFSGTLVTTVDAYGTLSLNDFGSGAYSGNVTRIKTVLNISMNWGILSNVGTINQTSYSYYDSILGTTNPIFRSTTSVSVFPLASINQTDISLEKFDSIILSTTKNVFASIWIKNPIENSIEINSQYPIDNATIIVTDILGKIIYQTKNISIQGVFEIPILLTNGVFLVSISNDNGSVSKKIVKN